MQKCTPKPTINKNAALKMENVHAKARISIAHFNKKVNPKLQRVSEDSLKKTPERIVYWPGTLATQ